MKSIAILICTLLLVLPLAIEPLEAAGKDELTLSGSYANPDVGPTVWTVAAEYLAAAGPFVIGPSFTIFDGAESDGNAFGVAAEWNLTGESGLFVRVAAHKLSGGAADVAEYTGELGGGLKFGSDRGGVKVYAIKTWTRDATGAVGDPEGLSAVGGLYLLF